MFELSEAQKLVMSADGNLLVLGGPGSGKTTVAILKAGDIVVHSLKPPQKIIFLSFARATVARIIEALDEVVENSKTEKQFIEVDTYHAFFWRLIRSHGYLLGMPRRLSVLAPAQEAIALSSIRNDYQANSKLSEAERKEKLTRELQERKRLSFENGQVCFDLFAHFASQLLCGSRGIRNLFHEAYPYIILDEFQDTDADEWTVVQALGEKSQIIALADPEQRIYDFRGADPGKVESL